MREALYQLYGWAISLLSCRPGDAAEPVRCRRDLFGWRGGEELWHVVVQSVHTPASLRFDWSSW